MQYFTWKTSEASIYIGMEMGGETEYSQERGEVGEKK